MLKYRQVGCAYRVANHRDREWGIYPKTAKQRALRGGFILSLVLFSERISTQNQTGDCEKKVESFNDRHAHHLRFCMERRGGNHPVEPLVYRHIIA